MRLATLRQGPAVLSEAGAHLLPVPVGELVALGLERALEVGEAALRTAPVPYDDADLLLPYRPPSVRDFVTFESHVEGVRRSIDHAAGVPEAWYDAPTFYFTNPHALYGPGEAIPRPVTCRALDFEMEVAAVVGHRAALRLDRARRRTRSSATRSSTTGPPATSSPARCRSASARPRARTSPRRSARGSSPPTSCRRWTWTAGRTSTASSSGTTTCRSMHFSFAEMVAHASRDSVVLRRRPARLRDDRWGRLPGRAVGPHGAPDPAAARAG